MCWYQVCPTHFPVKLSKMPWPCVSILVVFVGDARKFRNTCGAGSGTESRATSKARQTLRFVQQTFEFKFYAHNSSRGKMAGESCFLRTDLIASRYLPDSGKERKFIVCPIMQKGVYCFTYYNRGSRGYNARSLALLLTVLRGWV